MTDKKLTDNEIIKALECCDDEEELHWCTECPYYDKENDFCQEDLHRDALSLINRQKAEIERLRKENEMVVYTKSNGWGRISFLEFIKNQRAEAIKEFSERLKEIIGEMVDIMFDDNESKCRIKNCRYPSNIPCGNEICLEENKTFWNSKIDNLVKKMAGDGDG